MKFVLILSMIAFAGGAFADSERVTIERSRAVVPMTIELNQQTVRCLLGDYGSQSLKISVADLKHYTVFRQTTRGETEPCINAGSCVFGETPDGRPLSPELILDSSKPTEAVLMTIVMNEILEIDHQRRTCQRSLWEDVSAPVRGLDFKHSEGHFIGELDYETCVRMK